MELPHCARLSAAAALSVYMYALPIPTSHSLYRAAHTRLASRSLDRTLDKVVRNKGKKEITLVGAEDVTRLARLLTDRIAHAAAD